MTSFNLWDKCAISGNLVQCHAHRPCTFCIYVLSPLTSHSFSRCHSTPQHPCNTSGRLPQTVVYIFTHWLTRTQHNICLNALKKYDAIVYCDSFKRASIIQLAIPSCARRIHEECSNKLLFVDVIWNRGGNPSFWFPFQLKHQI